MQTVTSIKLQGVQDTGLWQKVFFPLELNRTGRWTCSSNLLSADTGPFGFSSQGVLVSVCTVPVTGLGKTTCPAFGNASGFS